ncbi:MAG: class I SAM-dependent methyltransferase, partial [Actinomycetota bacterium]
FLVNRFLTEFDRALEGHSPATIVEIGMGEGVMAERLTSAFPEARLLGVDLFDPRLVEEWARKGLTGVVADACHLPLPDDSVDLAVAVEVLEHIPDPAAALAEIARIGRGRVVLSVPLEPLWRAGNIARGRYLSEWGNTPGHLNHFSRRGFVRLVERFLTVEKVVQPLPWTFVVARAPAA